MASRSSFAFNISGERVGTTKPPSRGGQRATQVASRQSFDDRRGGTAPASSASSASDFEPSWHLDLGGLLNGGEKRSPTQPDGAGAGGGGAGAGGGGAGGAGGAGGDGQRGGAGRSIYSRGNDVRSSSEALRYATAAYGQPARRNTSSREGSRVSRSQQSKRGQAGAASTTPVRRLVDSPYGDALARPGSRPSTNGALRPGSRKSGQSRFMTGARPGSQGGSGLGADSLSVRSSWNGSGSGVGSRGGTPGSRVRVQAQAQREAQAKAQREAKGKAKAQRDSSLNDSGQTAASADEDDTNAESTDELHEQQRQIDSMSPTAIQASDVPGSAGPRRKTSAARPAALEHFPTRAARVDSESDSDLDDQLGGEMEVSEETFSNQPGGYADLDGRPSTAHRGVERPTTAGFMADGESTAEPTDRRSADRDSSLDREAVNGTLAGEWASAGGQTGSPGMSGNRQRYNLGNSRWRSTDEGARNPGSARQWRGSAGQNELGTDESGESSSSPFDRRARSAAAANSRNSLSPTELEDRPPSRGKAPPEALYLSGTLTSERSVDDMHPAHRLLSGQDAIDAAKARSASQPAAGGSPPAPGIGSTAAAAAGRSAFTTVPPASAVAVPPKQPAQPAQPSLSVPNSARSLPASTLGYQRDPFSPKDPTSSPVEGESAIDSVGGAGAAGGGAGGNSLSDEDDSDSNLLFQKRPPSRQKPPPDALHLDLPPRPFVPNSGQAHIERPPTASSKRRPQRAHTAGPLRGSAAQRDANDPFPMPGVGGGGGGNQSRPLSGFGRPTTRQELEELMGPLSRTELASAQVRNVQYSTVHYTTFVHHNR